MRSVPLRRVVVATAAPSAHRNHPSLLATRIASSTTTTARTVSSRCCQRRRQEWPLPYQSIRTTSSMQFVASNTMLRCCSRQHCEPLSSNTSTRSFSSSSTPKDDGKPPSSTHPSLILPSIVGLDDWREKARLDALERVRDSNRSSTAATGTATTATTTTTTNLSTEVVQLPVAELYRPDLHLPSAPTNWTGYEAATPLTNEVIALIGVTGRPLSTADYMRMALTHAEHGYYTNAISRSSGVIRAGSSSNRKDDEDSMDDFDRDDYDEPTTTSTTTAASTPVSSAGDSTIIGADFVTAPEVSNVFGECIGFWFAAVWNDQQEAHKKEQELSGDGISKRNSTKTEWQWLECGPGKGSLMVDLMRLTLQLSADDKEKTEINVDLALLFGNGCRHVHFIEQSPVFRQQQRQALMDAKLTKVRLQFDELPTTAPSSTSMDALNQQQHPQRIISVHWHDSLTDFQWWQKQNVPSDELLPTYVIGQEFLDALPVYAFEKTVDGNWRERLVDVALRDDLNDDEDEEDDSANTMPIEQAAGSAESSAPNTALDLSKQKKPRLRIVLAPEATPPLKTLLGTDQDGFLKASNPNENDAAPVGSVVEVCPEGVLFVQDVAEMIDAQGGAALFIDYGSDQGSRDSLRGFSRHQQVHFLSRPGQVDITADVDFMALRHAVNNRKVTAIANSPHTSTPPLPQHEVDRLTRSGHAMAFGPVKQGEFLMAMGIRERIISLLERDDCTEDMADNLVQALMRLASPEEMGERYKVLAIAAIDEHAVEDRPPGF